MSKFQFYFCFLAGAIVAGTLGFGGLTLRDHGKAIAVLKMRDIKASQVAAVSPQEVIIQLRLNQNGQPVQLVPAPLAEEAPAVNVMPFVPAVKHMNLDDSSLRMALAASSGGMRDLMLGMKRGDSQDLMEAQGPAQEMTPRELMDAFKKNTDLNDQLIETSGVLLWSISDGLPLLKGDDETPAISIRLASGEDLAIVKEALKNRERVVVTGTCRGSLPKPPDNAPSLFLHHCRVSD